MAFSHALSEAGTPPTGLRTAAEVDFQPGVGITEICLHVSGDVPGLDHAAFEVAANAAKEGCPVSQALKLFQSNLSLPN